MNWHDPKFALLLWATLGLALWTLALPCLFKVTRTRDSTSAAREY